MQITWQLTLSKSWSKLRAWALSVASGNNRHFTGQKSTHKQDVNCFFDIEFINIPFSTIQHHCTGILFNLPCAWHHWHFYSAKPWKRSHAAQTYWLFSPLFHWQYKNVLTKDIQIQKKRPICTPLYVKKYWWKLGSWKMLKTSVPTENQKCECSALIRLSVYILPNITEVLRPYESQVWTKITLK